MTTKFKKLISRLALTLAIVGQAITVQADSIEVNPEYKQELMQELTLNAENLFHNSDEMQKYVQSTEVIDKESNKKPVNYFSIINVIVNDALNLGLNQKTSASVTVANSGKLQVR